MLKVLIPCNVVIFEFRQILHRVFCLPWVNGNKKGFTQNLPNFKIQGTTQYWNFWKFITSLFFSLDGVLLISGNFVIGGFVIDSVRFVVCSLERGLYRVTHGWCNSYTRTHIYSKKYCKTLQEMLKMAVLGVPTELRTSDKVTEHVTQLSWRNSGDFLCNSHFQFLECSRWIMFVNDIFQVVPEEIIRWGHLQMQMRNESFPEELV